MKFLRLGMLVLGGAGMVGVLAVLGYQVRANARTRAEIAAARASTTDLVTLRAEHARLAAAAPATAKRIHAEQDEIARLKIERDALRLQFATLQRENVPHAEHQGAQRARLAAQAAAIPVPPGMFAPEMLRNVGRETPAAAWQTSQWAVRTNDLAAKLELSAFAPQVRDALQAIFDTLAPEEREAFGTPERMGLRIMALDGQIAPVELRIGFPRVQLVSTTPAGPDDVMLVERVQAQDGSIYERPPFRMHRFPDGWKWLMGPETIGAIRARLAAMPPAQRRALGSK